MLILLCIVAIVLIVVIASRYDTGVEDEVNFPYEDSDESED